jgi:hypothetical protein
MKPNAEALAFGFFIYTHTPCLARVRLTVGASKSRVPSQWGAASGSLFEDAR